MNQSSTIFGKQTSYYVLFPVIGFAIFYIYRSGLSITSRMSDAWIDQIAAVLENLDAIILPRSIFELSLVRDNLGDDYFFIIAIFDLIIGVAGLTITAIVQRYPNPFTTRDVDFGNVQLVASIGCIIFSLLYRPAHLDLKTFVANNINADGIYLIRESIWMAGGYYYLSVIIMLVRSLF